MSRMIALAMMAALLAPATASATEKEREALQERNARELQERMADRMRGMEVIIRGHIREECRLDRLRLDIDTCNRISGLDRFFIEKARGPAR